LNQAPGKKERVNLPENAGLNVRTGRNQDCEELAGALNWFLAKPLVRIRVKKSALAANRAEFGNQLNCADFIIRRQF